MIGNKKKPALINKHKKNDDVNIEPDEESRSFVEKRLEQDNKEKIDVLSEHVTAMKSLSKGMGQQLEEEKTVLKDLDSGFDKTKVMVQKALGRMDTVLV